MKSILAAITMMVATPAFAQSATPADAPAQHTHQAGTTGHEGHDMSSDCCAKGADGKMACCAKMKADGKATAPSAAPAADPHAGHDMGH